MFGVLSVFHTSRGATAYLFPGIDGQWSVATAQILRGRPDLVAWSREVATAVDDWAAGSAPQLTGWFTARPSSWLLDSEARPEHALAPQALAGCVLNGLLAAQERRLDCQDSVILGHSAGMLPGWVLATSTSYRETGMFSVSEAAAALQLALLMGIHAQASPWAIGASDLRPLLEGPDDGATSPMASISGMSVDELRSMLVDVPDVAVAMTNTAIATVVSGRPAALAQLQRQLNAQQESREADRKRGRTRAAAQQVRWEWLSNSAPFHHPSLAGFDPQRLEWSAEEIGTQPLTPLIDAGTGAPSTEIGSVIDAILSRHQDWATSVRETVGEQGRAILLGRSLAILNLTRTALSGTGSSITENTLALSVTPDEVGNSQATSDEASARAGLNQLAASSGAPHPDAIDIDGLLRIDNRHTRLTGRSPIILAGMTPTTVDVPIVAAAANAGHVAELAGGGQVTERVFNERLKELKEELHTPHEVVFNALHLDPYLWDLHLGADRLVQKAKADGAPICGVTISGGIPEIDVAVPLLRQLRERGIWLNALKPGTNDQIAAALKIAEAYEAPLWLHVEGGAAGGHHSWEDLEALLLHNYDAIRGHDNVVLCAGGGISSPEDAQALLSGDWALPHTGRRMPVDAVLIGTLAMATAEATTSAEVKELLRAAEGTQEVVPRGDVVAGIRSGLSGLNADIHFLDNTASRTAALLDTVAGDAEAVDSRRDEIIEALAGTAKPYFGDLETSTYEAALQRFVALTAIGRGGRYEDGPWLDPSHRAAFLDILHRFEGRLCEQDSGLVATQFQDDKIADDPGLASNLLFELYPDGRETTLHPADVHFLHSVWERPGKPMPFVSRIDADIRRRYQSDSLWQSQNEHYRGDEVLVIPGPSAVGGITVVDEPVADLLDRFEQQIAGSIIATAASKDGDTGAAGTPTRRSRQTDDILHEIIAAPTWRWLDQSRPNPLRSIRNWRFEEKRAIARVGDEEVSLRTLPGTRAEVRFSWPTLTGQAEARLPLSTAVSEGMLSVQAGTNDLAELGRQLVARTGGPYGPHNSSDTVAHRNQVGAATALPDRVMAAAWPSIFSALADAGFSASLLDLVHRSHEIRGVVPAELGPVHHVTSWPPTVQALSGALLVTINTTINADVDIELVDTFHINRPGMAADPAKARLGSAGEATGPDATDGGYALAPFQLGELSMRTPESAEAFAAITGDGNPIHRSDAFARFCGLEDRIIHGMWTSALAQRAALEHSGCEELLDWRISFSAPVPLDHEVTALTSRVGRRDGNDILEVEVRDGDVVAATAHAVVAGPATAYVFPGQGIQQQGMGMAAAEASPAARAIWRRADEHTRAELGFSILKVVKDNPTSLSVRGRLYRHPAGVLNLTQFTQVAMATLAAAQVAQLREAGAFSPTATFAGHSVGEYNALASCTDVLSLEAVLELVFARGESMHQLVPRHVDGSSDYRLGVIRPHLAGLSEQDSQALVAEVAATTGELCEIVNLNLRGKQYAVAGTVTALEMLEARLAGTTKPAFLLVPGIDVPFHSSALRGGVADFRKHLERCLPPEIDPDVLTGRYIPNLYPVAFELTREYVSAVAQTADSEILRGLLADWERTPAPEACRTLLVELLAWQFASPVRWIETVDVLCQGQIERIVEVGVGHAPTLTNLIKGAIALPHHSGTRPEVLNFEVDAEQILGGQDEEDGATHEPAEPVTEQVAGAPEAAAVPAQPDASGQATPVADIRVDVVTALRALLALRAQVGERQLKDQTIDDLVAGASSRRNQLLLDLGKEFAVGSIDGAHELPLPVLAEGLRERAKSYRYPGPVLRPLVDKSLTGLSVAQIEARVSRHWELGPGWSAGVTLLLACENREGASKLGGALRSLEAADPDGLIDAAVRALAERLGIPVREPARAAEVMDSGALADLREHYDAALAATARTLLDAVEPPQALLSSDANSLGLAADPEYLAAIAPSFDPRRHVALASGRFWARSDAERLQHQASLAEREGRDPATDPEVRSLAAGVSRFATDSSVKALLEHSISVCAASHLTATVSLLQDTAAGHADGWDQQDGSRWAALSERDDSRELREALNQLPADCFCDEVALVTGASPGSIAEALVARLLRGGATVVVTTSNDDDDRIAHYRDLERTHAGPGAELHIVRANLASYEDIDALVQWLTTPTVVDSGLGSEESKPALWPTIVAPFAATSDPGTMAETGTDTEVNLRLLLLGVQRLVGRVGERIIAEDQLPATVLLPLSPNHGNFGGDGAYAAAKAGLETIAARWHSEQRAWGAGVRIVAATIGWVRGTGLMAGNDGLAESVARLGVRTFSSEEMGGLLATSVSAGCRGRAASAPWTVRLTGGLDDSLDLSSLKATSGETEPVQRMIPALSGLARPRQPWQESIPVRPSLAADDMIVIVGAAELGPWGGSATRHAAELAAIDAEAVSELAWRCGLVTWDERAIGWRDAESGDLVPEHELADRYEAKVRASCGIRRLERTDGLADLVHFRPVQTGRPVVLTARDEQEARELAAGQEAAVIRADSSDQWTVTLPPGTSLTLRRERGVKRQVGAQPPSGSDPKRHGLAPGADIDPLAAWNLVVTAEAFRDADLDPEELERSCPPSLIGNTQGSGMGGMTSIRSLYVDPILGREGPNDLLQEALGNVVSAHTNQALVGGYGPMVHPVAACATAAVSLEEAVDKIRLGKAEFVVAGGWDDISAEGIDGFANMSATADNEQLEAAGIPPHRQSRPGDRRRAGFVESAGGGSFLVCRGSLARELGLPVRAVVMYGSSFGDGIQTSIPAPGLGALGAAAGGPDSPLARALADHGLSVDDVSVVSKHDTSTRANDPNEAFVHARIQDNLGRSAGAPLHVISQKSLTGHAKGGAAAWQLAGLIDVFATGVIPGNRSLTCVDEQTVPDPLVVDYRSLTRSEPVRAALLTSLGFGHISSLVAVAHPGVFVAGMSPDDASSYRRRADDRNERAARRRVAERFGGEPAFRPRARRFAGPDGRRRETALLLSGARVEP